MTEEQELKALQEIEGTLIPPFEPWLIIYTSHGTCDISTQLYQFFKEQNIDIESRDNTERVLKLCEHYNIKTRRMIF